MSNRRAAVAWRLVGRAELGIAEVIDDANRNASQHRLCQILDATEAALS